MDKDKKIEQNNIDLKSKETIANQIDSIINQNKEQKNSMGATPNYSEVIIKDGALINKIARPTESEKQIRSIIRTYKSDVEETIQTSHISSINMAMAENRKMMGQAKQTEVEEKKTKTNKNILIVSLVLIFGGVLTFFVPQLLIKLQYGEKTAPVETVSSLPIMTVDLEEKVNTNDIGSNKVSTALEAKIDQSATELGQIKNMYITEGSGNTEKLITSSKFLGLINASVPPEIQRTLKDQYMLGMYNYNGNQKFLILKIGSYDTAFSGMLSWETSLWQDFKGLFDLESDSQDNSDDSASSSNPFALEIRKFEDATFNNKDCRIVKDSSGNIVFLYSIIDEDTIAITTSVDTLKEIINRVSKARVVTQ